MEPSTGRATANGVTFQYLEMGRGPLVLCLHGFPDNAYTYTDLLPVLAAAGFRGVAPFMRGYAPTTPAPDGRYQSVLLAQDAVALIAALGAERAFLVGHDWGAAATYGAAALAPERIERIVTSARPIQRPSAAISPRATSATRASGTPTSFKCRTPSRSWPPTTLPSSRTGGETPPRSSIPPPSSSA